MVRCLLSMWAKASALQCIVLVHPRGLPLQMLLITAVPNTVLVLTLSVCRVEVALAEKTGPLALLLNMMTPLSLSVVTVPLSAKYLVIRGTKESATMMVLIFRRCSVLPIVSVPTMAVSTLTPLVLTWLTPLSECLC